MRLLLFCAALAIATNTRAADFSCARLNAETSGPDMNFRPPIEGKVVGGEKTFLYSAPNNRCRTRNVVVTKGGFLTVYKPYKDWLKVMYITKNGEDHIGWDRKHQVRLLGHYGGEQQTPNFSSTGRAEARR